MPHRLDYFPNKDLIGYYRKIFSSNEGQEVLAHMLFDLGTFIEISDGDEDIALKNYANRLLKILSGSEPSKDSIQLFTKSLMKQQIPKEKENDDT